MKNLKEYLSQITQIDDNLLMKIAAFAKTESLKKGDFFIKEGKIARRIAFLQKGIVRGFCTGANGTEYNKKFFLAPAMIGGYTSLITGKPSIVAQQALTDCELITLPYFELTKLYDEHPKLERIARVVAEQFFVEKEQREVNLVQLDATQRYHIFKESFPNLEQEIPQYHIASYLGVSATQLSRIRKQISKKN